MMTPQESQLLQDFLNQLTQVSGVPKDPQAEAAIAKAVAQQPDAAYLLVQRTLLLEQALNQSKAQVSQLQNEIQSLRASNASANTGGFLDAGSAWGHSAAGNARPTVAAVAPANFAQDQMPLQMPQVAARPGFFGSNTGNFLTNVAATAAGVAGGAFLFQGIENLMGHHHGLGSGFLGQSGLNGTPIENTTVNNYYSADTSTPDSARDDFTNLVDDVDSGGDGGDSDLTSI